MKAKDLVTLAKKVDGETEVFVHFITFDMNGLPIKSSVFTADNVVINTVTNHLTDVTKLGLLIVHTEKISKETELAIKQVN